MRDEFWPDTCRGAGFEDALLRADAFMRRSGERPEPRPEPRTDEEAAAVLRDILKSVLILVLAGAVLLALLAPRSVMAQEKGVYVVKAAQVITVDGTMHEVTQGAYFTPAAHLAVAKETVRLQDENRVLKSERVSPVLLVLLSVGLAGAAAYGG